MTERHMSRAERRRAQRADARMATYIERLKGIIRDTGWAVQAVGADPAEMQPGFAYTVGLTLAGLPELVIVGLPPTVAGSLLNDLASRMIRDDEFDVWRYVNDQEELTDLANLPTRLIEVDFGLPEHTEYAAFARRFYGPDNVRAVQVVWPDPAGHWPWQDEFNVGFKVPVLAFVTKTGKVLTPADIEALADEAEAGYDPTSFTPRDRKQP